MAYLSEDALRGMGFAELGRNVKISDKAAIYGADQMRIGDNSRIDDFCVVSGNVQMQRNSHLSPFCLVNGGTAGVSIGEFTGLSYGVKVFAHSDDYSGEALIGPTVPREYTKVYAAFTDIGRHVVIGAGSIVSAGASIGDGCAIGAATLVLKPLPAWGVYIGIPARKLHDRKRDLLKLEEKYLLQEG